MCTPGILAFYTVFIQFVQSLQASSTDTESSPLSDQICGFATAVCRLFGNHTSHELDQEAGFQAAGGHRCFDTHTPTS